MNVNEVCRLEGYSDLWITHGYVTHLAYKRHECDSCQRVEKDFVNALKDPAILEILCNIGNTKELQRIITKYETK